MAVASPSTATTFSLKTPLLSKGRSMDLLASTDLMTAHVKVYAEGGENAMHTHSREDHIFVVLAGQATFHLEQDDNTAVLNRNEGILLPKGAYYWFQSSGEENLVLLRVGASRDRSGDDRVNPGGQPLPGGSAENKHIEGVPLPGRFFE